MRRIHDRIEQCILADAQENTGSPCFHARRTHLFVDNRHFTKALVRGKIGEFRGIAVFLAFEYRHGAVFYEVKRIADITFSHDRVAFLKLQFFGRHRHRLKFARRNGAKQRASLERGDVLQAPVGRRFMNGHGFPYGLPTAALPAPRAVIPSIAKAAHR
jgi:hypothetical protein